MQQVEPVAAHRLVFGVDLHRLEKRIDGRAQPGHRAHRGGEVLGLHCRCDLGLGGVERGEECLFLRRLGQFRIGAEGVFDPVGVLGLREDVVRALEPLQQVLAILGFQHVAQRLSAPHQQRKVVGTGHGKTGIDYVVANAFIAQMDLEALVEESEEVRNQS